MRRAEIQEAIGDAIDEHFPSDVGDKFEVDDLDGVARLFQERDLDERSDIEKAIRDVVANTKGKTFDWIADGECREPAAWLYKAVSDNL